MEERRYHRSERPAQVNCRLCYTQLHLEPEVLHQGSIHWYATCPHCGGTFPVRAEDSADAEQLTNA